MIDNAPMAEGYGHSFTRRNWIRRSRTAKGRHRFLKARRNAEAVADIIVKSGIVDSEALDELMLELDQQTVASEKEKGNRKGRKARLKALEERADFEEYSPPKHGFMQELLATCRAILHSIHRSNRENEEYKPR